MAKVPNELWYLQNDKDVINYGKVLCYEHDDENCDKCDRCNQKDLCQSCFIDVKRHSKTQSEECIRKLSSNFINADNLISAIQHVTFYSLTAKKIKIDDKTVFERDKK